MASFGVIFQ